jgi:outer membrane immunogenic protein
MKPMAVERREIIALARRRWRDGTPLGGNILNKLLLSCVTLIGLTGFARSADMYVQSLAPVSSWTGCYIGGHAGYGMATATSYYAYPDSPVLDSNGFFTTGDFIQTFNNKGFVGGGQVGCQQQKGSFLWGVEGDWSSFSNGNSGDNFASGFSGGGVSFSQSFNQSLSYSSLWSVRGRLGAIVFDVFHLYGTAGVGGATANYTYAVSFKDSGAGFCGCGASIANNLGMGPTGFVLGAGAEWKIWSNVVVGAEYLHYFLSSDKIIPLNTTAIEPLAAFGDHVQTNNVDVVRLRASYLFNFGR